MCRGPSNAEQIGPKFGPPSLMESCPPEPLVLKPKELNDSWTYDKAHCLGPQSRLYPWRGEVPGTVRACSQDLLVPVPGY